MNEVSVAWPGCFPADFSQSRRSFLTLSAAAGAELTSFPHPQRGPHGESLATDVASFGVSDARGVLIVSCGTHGIEGLCGAGIQAAILRSGLYRERSSDVALILVHALNPHGFAHLRRTDEDNIDPNRNFLQHGGSYPDDSAYSEIHPLLVPSDWDGPARRAADASLAHYAAERGAPALQAVVTRGQYTHPDGLFYGGRKPTWSNLSWHEILHRFAGHAQYVGAIDLHSGLGARGACELICAAVRHTPEHSLAQRLFGAGLVFPGLSSTAATAQGYMGASLAQALPSAAAALVVAEFGTVEFNTILQVLRADNWLHARGEIESPLGRRIKEQMRAAFVGADPAWQSAVLERALPLVRRALASLTEVLEETS